MGGLRCTVLLVLLVSACQSSFDAPAAKAKETASASAARPSAPAELDQLDARKPVPLLPMMANHQKQNMRDHLAVVQEVVAALGTRDFDKVTQSARRMGYSGAMEQMCKHMGSGAPGFTEQALTFHHSADRIADAAEKNDSDGVITALAETLATCTSCHATYKQKLVETLPE
ncbi:MAG TPA: cytochrome c [Polyangiaceae bacterium]|nr:cytochrome c [Polyangiaceae bacterium]